MGISRKTCSELKCVCGHCVFRTVASNTAGARRPTLQFLHGEAAVTYTGRGRTNTAATGEHTQRSPQAAVTVISSETARTTDEADLPSRVRDQALGHEGT
jgi:hypothetical protein